MISIVIPTYNRAYIIRHTLDSICSQEYQQWECVVVDDYSTDETETVIKEYTRKDSRFHFLRNSRTKGAQGARNTGILAAKGEWIVLFDSDNIMKPDFLLKISELFSKEYGVINTWSNVLNSSTNEKIREFNWVNNGSIHQKLLAGKCYVDNSSTAIRKNLLLNIGLLAEDCPAFQEWDTHLRISRHASYYTIEECLVDYYSGAADAISSDKSKDVKGYLYILGKYRCEWIKKEPFQFLRYCAILNMFIRQLDNNKQKLFKKKYKEISGIYQPVISLLTKLLTLKLRKR